MERLYYFIYTKKSIYLVSFGQIELQYRFGDNFGNNLSKRFN